MSNTTEKRIGQRVAYGALWSIALNISTRALSLVSIIILARLITPRDLGIYAAAAVVVELVNVLTDVGIYPALIHRKNPTVRFYQTAWTIQVIRGVFIFCVLQVFAEYFIYFYSQDPAVQQAVQVVSFTALISCFQSIYLADFEKNIDFKKLMKFNIVSRFIGFVVTIVAAYILRSFWALVIGALASSAVRLALSYKSAPGPHRFTLKSANELVSFSRWVLVHQIGAYVSLKSDMILVTRFLGTETLGIYEVGYRIAMLPTLQIAVPVSRALFPGLSKLQDQSTRFAEMLSYGLASILYIALPAGVGLIMVAEPLVTTLFPKNWHDAAYIVQVLAIFGVFRVVFGPCVSALMGRGYVELNAKLTLVNVVMRFGALGYGVISHGLEGLVIAAALVAPFQAAIYVGVLKRKKMVSLSQLWTTSWRSVVSSCAMALALEVSFSTSFLESTGSAIILASYVALGCVVYFAMVAVLWVTTGRQPGIEEIVFSRLKGRT